MRGTRAIVVMLTVIGIISVVWLLRRDVDPVMPMAPQAGAPAVAAVDANPHGLKNATAATGDQPGKTGSTASTFPAIAVAQKKWSAAPAYASVSAALRDLLPVAQGGNTHAMLAIAQSIGNCRLGIATDPVAKEMKADLIAAGQSTDGEVDERVARTRAYCDRPAAEMISLYRYWALRAADEGDGEAALFVAFETPWPVDMGSLLARQKQLGGNDPELFEQITALSLRYAQLARDRGELKGALILAMARAGSTPDATPLEGYENAWLASRVLEAEGLKPMDRWLKDNGDLLLPIQREEAQVRARALLRQIPEWSDRIGAPSSAAPDAISPAP